MATYRYLLEILSFDLSKLKDSPSEYFMFARIIASTVAQAFFWKTLWMKSKHFQNLVVELNKVSGFQP